MTSAGGMEGAELARDRCQSAGNDTERRRSMSFHADRSEVRDDPSGAGGAKGGPSDRRMREAPQGNESSVRGTSRAIRSPTPAVASAERDKNRYKQDVLFRFKEGGSDRDERQRSKPGSGGLPARWQGGGGAIAFCRESEERTADSTRKAQSVRKRPLERPAGYAV